MELKMRIMFIKTLLLSLFVIYILVSAPTSLADGSDRIPVQSCFKDCGSRTSADCNRYCVRIHYSGGSCQAKPGGAILCCCS
ncbi:hypothetical protein FRX31_020707 [Thalictrum thalictroides]|uniref:Defensin-like protein n=1 Tax=Thalictrum thalictroides TaxID=46969 RepID=A0A7J6VX52_THATH|nr:hypothetical protein FRX31_020707 [Thalictrum thalictroides]